MMDMLVMGLVFAVLVVIILIANKNIPEPFIPTSKPKKVWDKPKPRAKSKAKPVDPLLKSAQSTLVSLGFPASEANKLLAGVMGATVEEYVSNAMKKVKI